MNPGPATGAGLVKTRVVTLPPLSQTTVDPRWDLGDTDFSTKVTCLEGRPIAVDRTMFWTGQGAPCPEAHNSVGISAPANVWYLPEGSSAWNFETWTLIQNPNPGAVRVEVTYLPQGGGRSVTFTDEISPNSRKTYNMAGAENTYPGIQGRASIVVRSLDGARPIMVERSMYCYGRGLGTDTVGAYSD